MIVQFLRDFFLAFAASILALKLGQALFGLADGQAKQVRKKIGK